MEQPKIIINKSETLYKVSHIDEKTIDMVASIDHENDTIDILDVDGHTIFNNYSADDLRRTGRIIVNIAKYAQSLKNKKAASVN